MTQTGASAMAGPGAGSRVLRSIADRLEHVLRVDKEMGRTSVRWISPTEIEQMAADDVTHLAGLSG